MNAILLGAASLGALGVCFTHKPDSLSANVPASPEAALETARAAADDAEVARLREAAPDEGSMQDVTIVDPGTGKTTTAQTLPFKG